MERFVTRSSLLTLSAIIRNNFINDLYALIDDDIRKKIFFKEDVLYRKPGLTSGTDRKPSIIPFHP